MRRPCRVAAPLAAAALVTAGCSDGGDVGGEPSPASGARLAVANSVSVRVRIAEAPAGGGDPREWACAAATGPQVTAVPQVYRRDSTTWSSTGADQVLAEDVTAFAVAPR